MRKLTATLCLNLAVLLGSISYISTTSASDFYQSRFGQVTLNLPYPSTLCLLGHSPGEQVLRKHQILAQRKSGNKLLAMWIDCDSQRRIKNGVNASLEEWVIVVGGLTGNPKSERVYPRLSPDKYLDLFAKKYGKLSLEKIGDQANKILDKANSLYFGDKNAAKVYEPINLGVLSIGDSVNVGMIFNMRANEINRPTLIIMSSLLIEGVPLHHYFYTEYKKKSNVKNLLSKSKYYTAKIIHSN